MRTFFITIAGLLAAALTALPAGAGEYTGPGFSGDYYYGENGTADQPAGTMHVGRAGMRMNMSSDGQKSAMLVLWNEENVITLMIDQKMYMELTPEQTGGLGDFDGKPCFGYKSAKKLGSETVAGRETVKWRCTGELKPEPGEPASDTTIWFDRELKFPIRDVNDSGDVFEVRNIKIGRQDASLFKIPPGFKKFDMGAMMQQLQQQQ